MSSPENGKKPEVVSSRPGTDPVEATDPTPEDGHPARNAAARQRPDDTAGRHDWQGKPREGRGRRQAGLCLHRQPAGAAALDCRARRRPGGEDAAGPGALCEMGHCMVRRRRRLVFLLRRLRRSRQLYLRPRHVTHTRTARQRSIGMGKDSRGVDLETVDDLDDGLSRLGWDRPRPSPVSGKEEPCQGRGILLPMMTRYLILLRGINVGGRNKVPMAALRELLDRTATRRSPPTSPAAT